MWLPGIYESVAFFFFYLERKHDIRIVLTELYSVDCVDLNSEWLQDSGDHRVSHVSNIAVRIIEHASTFIRASPSHPDTTWEYL